MIWVWLCTSFMSRQSVFFWKWEFPNFRDFRVNFCQGCISNTSLDLVPSYFLTDPDQVRHNFIPVQSWSRIHLRCYSNPEQLPTFRRSSINSGTISVSSLSISIKILCHLPSHLHPVVSRSRFPQILPIRFIQFIPLQNIFNSFLWSSNLFLGSKFCCCKCISNLEVVSSR